MKRIGATVKLYNQIFLRKNSAKKYKYRCYQKCSHASIRIYDSEAVDKHKIK